MENEIQPNITQTQPLAQVPTPVSPPANWIKIILFILLGIVIIAGSVFAGIRIGKKQIASPQKTTEQPAVFPTQVVVNPTAGPITISPTVLSPTTDLTVNWKTYENKKWGFSVKYPEKFFTACYPEEGLKLWGPNFDCNVPHDIFYTISAIGYEDIDYKPYKKASKSEPIVVAGKNATKNIYIFDESDGPLFELHEETEIVIPLQSGLIQLVLLGQEEKNKVFFDQIISTFKFTD